MIRQLAVMVVDILAWTIGKALDNANFLDEENDD